MVIKIKRGLLGILLVLFLIVISSVTFFQNVIYGKEIETSNADDYGNFEGFKNMSALVVFPDVNTPYISQDYYYQLKDEINSPRCQIYLKRQYTSDEYRNEIERLCKWKLSYLSQTNHLYIDNSQYMNTTFVAIENYNNCYEYAITLDNINTIVYVYLKNIDFDELYMDKMFLPAYLQNETTEDDWKNSYAFLIGGKYVVCMDLTE